MPPFKSTSVQSAPNASSGRTPQPTRNSTRTPASCRARGRSPRSPPSSRTDRSCAAPGSSPAIKPHGCVEQLAPQRQMEALHLPGRGRRAGLGEPVRDAVAAADLVEEHLAAASEAIGGLLAVICEHLLRRAIALQRLREGHADRAAGRALDDAGKHAIARVIIDAGDDPAVADLAGDRVDQPRPVDDVPLPELQLPAAANAHSPSAACAAPAG